MGIICLTCLFQTLVLLSFFARPLHGLCDPSTFWAPNRCPTTGGDLIPYNEWGCRSCYANSVQYVSPYGDQKDEACMCNTGYVASYKSMLCTYYVGGYVGVEYPPVEDKFQCDFCNGDKGEFCQGGVYSYYSQADLKAVDDDFYRVCTAANCVSGYVRVWLDSQISGATHWSTTPHLKDAVSTRYSMGSSLDGKDNFKHAPKRYCKIFGQRAIVDPAAGLLCKCPANSMVLYRYAKDPNSRCPGTPSYVAPTDGLGNLFATMYQEVVCINVWNLDIVPDFSPPAAPSSGVPSKYFGYCQCPGGYYRLYGQLAIGPDRNEFYYADCTTCPVGSYCLNGIKTGCSAGWTTASTGSNDPLQCSVCSGCDFGMYCKTDDPTKYNVAGAQCSACGQGFYCDSKNLASPKTCTRGFVCPGPMNVNPSPCPDGTYSDVSGLAQCKPCSVGSYSAKLRPSDSIYSCSPCNAGTYQDGQGQSSCKPCDAAGRYQDQKGQTQCKSCPRGYRNRDLTLAGSTTVHITLSDACEPCPEGTYNPTDGAGICLPCPLNTYNPWKNQTSCQPCPAGQLTHASASKSIADCFCPPGQFDSGLRKCMTCGKCDVGEYMVSTCNATNNVVCAVCDPCSDRQSFVDPGTMCNGYGQQRGQQACLWCRTEDACRQQQQQQQGAGTGTLSSYVQYSTLFKCLSGQTSYDSTVCVQSDKYQDPLRFQCEAGTYLDWFDPISPSSGALARSSIQFEDGSSVLLNSNNTFLAEVVPIKGVLRIYATRSSYEPFQVLSEASMASGNVVPAMEIGPYWMDDGSRTYTFACYFGGVMSSTFVHPMSGSSAGVAVPMGDVGYQSYYGGLLSSGTWSVDGTAFFAVWMDGTISKAVVWPRENRAFVPLWSLLTPPASATNILTPLWAARHPSTQPLATYVRHACISVPVHTSDRVVVQNALPASRQIQLICLYTFVRDDRIRSGAAAGAVQVDASSSFGSYLVRVLANGTRLPVDVGQHDLLHASTSLFYDISFNSIYVTTYEQASYSGKKKVLKVRLSPSYNFLKGPSGPSVIHPSQWIMPQPKAAGSMYPSYPLGMGLDFAAVEPLSGSLFFYATSMVSPTSMLSQLYYIPQDDPSGAPERVAQPILSEDPDTSDYANGGLSPISTIYGPNSGATMAFTLYAGLFVRYGWLSRVFMPVASCSSCPPGMTSDRGARQVAECRCMKGTYMNYTVGGCVPVTKSCPPGNFISRLPLPNSDTQCLPCFPCPPGFYRDPDDCLPNVYRDPTLPARCKPCSKCPSGMYIDVAKCSPYASVDHNPSTDCLTCNTCRDMENIVGLQCPGDTTYNTQLCQTCYATCPPGTTISPLVDRCSGKTRAMTPDYSTAPFDPVSECVPCPPCEYATGMARVAGCTGTSRYDPPRCEACLNTCSLGEYIVGECSTSSTVAQCVQCPACEVGKYLARPCTGTKLGEPDQVCQPCAKCGADTYVSPCGRSDPMYQPGWKFVNATSRLVQLPRPSDAGICMPCRTCDNGSYISKRCSGANTFDDRECQPCTATCPAGTYMYARCKGNTFEPDSNDCRPCTPCNMGEYMRSGKCVDGTGATDPLQRTCRACASCRAGEYRTSLCTGTDFFQVFGCAPCQPCPEGYYLSKPCNGTGTSGSYPDRVCSPCKSCPVGYYRAPGGCSDGPGTGTSSTATYDEVICLPCDPCPDGFHISSDSAQQCPGTGYSPTQRTCVKCDACLLQGQYFSSGCTGTELSGTRTCANCSSACPEGFYIAAGCNGTTSWPYADRCLPCDPCPASSTLSYISKPCPGTGTSPRDRVCTPCSCPVGFVPRSGGQCSRSGTVNHVCVNAYGQVYYPPQISSTATPSPSYYYTTTTGNSVSYITTATDTTKQQTSAVQPAITTTANMRQWTTTASSTATPVATTPAPTPDAGGGGGLSSAAIAGIAAGAGALLLVGVGFAFAFG